MRCFYLAVAVCAKLASNGLAARMKKTIVNVSIKSAMSSDIGAAVTNVEESEVVDHDSLVLHEAEEAQDYEFLDEDYESDGPKDLVDGGVLLEEDVEEDVEATEEAGAPRCCYNGCCQGNPRKRNKCIAQLNMCHRSGGGSFPLPGQPVHVRPGQPLPGPKCCYKNCCIGKPEKRDRCIRELGTCHRTGGSFNGGFHPPHGGSFNGGFHPPHGGFHPPHGRPGGGFKKKEICCMCQRMNFGHMEWFPGEDYTKNGNAMFRCNTECHSECSRKGATFAGCWDEGHMKKLRNDARRNPSWTITGMPDDWFGDNPHDIC